MTPRANMRVAIDKGVPERLPLCDSFWAATLERWRREGLPADREPHDYFGLDWRFVYLDASLQLDEQLLEVTEEYAVRRNAYGATARYSRRREAPAELLDLEIKTRADWERLKGRMVANTDRISPTGFYSLVEGWAPPEPSWLARKARMRRILDEEQYVVACFYAGFEAVWRKTGYERALVAIADDPAWVRDMNEVHTDMMIETVRLMCSEGLQVDGALVACDLGSKTGPLISPAAFRELELPPLRRLTAALRGLGIQCIYHSDGNVAPLIPLLIEAGIHCLQPLEVNAGMDVRALETQYGGDLALMGNISHTEMMLPDEAQAKAAIQDKVRTACRGGGYVYHSDHSVPPSVSLRRYQKVLEWVREAGKA